MSDATLTVIAKLDDESKKLLNAVAKALVASGKGGSGKGKPAAAEAEDDLSDGADDAGDDGMDFDDGADDAGGDDEGTDDTGPTLDDVGEAMKIFATAPGGSKANAMKILKVKGKTDKLSALKPANFKAVIDTCAAETKKLKAAAKKK